MSQSFEEFLKENRGCIGINETFVKELGEGNNNDLLNIFDLGEWAWEKYLDWSKPIEGAERNTNYGDWKNTFVFDIAIACLGKNEIENRLKELNKE